MKKNIRYNLLKSLFLTGTILTISACNKGDKNNANTELQNEIQSLKQQLSENWKETKQITKEKEVIEQELKQYEEKAKETEENDKKLLESIKTEISTLTTIDNTINFSNGLDDIKVLLEQISSDDTKSKATKYFKDKIKFDFVEDDATDQVDFKCGNLCIENINYNINAFYRYCYLAKKVMDIVGCDDDYKIDLSQYSEKWNHELYNKLKSFPKEYFSTAKTFSFNIYTDASSINVTAGWENNTLKYTIALRYIIERIVEQLFFLYDINPVLIDKNFDFNSIFFENVIYENLENFNFEFNFKNKNLGFFCSLPISNFCGNLDFYSLKFDGINQKIIFLKSDGNHLWEQQLDNLHGRFNVKEFFNFLKSKNISIKNRPAIVLEANNIGLKNPFNGLYSFETTNCHNYDNLLYCLKVLNSLKDCDFIDVDKVSLDFGSDENSLNLGNFDLLNFNFGYYNMFNKDVAYFLSLLFKLLDVDYTVKFDGDKDIIKLSKNGETYSYKLNTSSYLEKVI